VPDFPPLVDVHCHLLPGVDDGAADWDVSLAMARMAVADGIATAVVTPHQSDAFAANDAPAIVDRTAQLQSYLDERDVALRVLPGGEVRVEPELPAKLRQGKRLTMADRKRHVLLELPHDVYFPLERLLGDLASVGITGILAHPERNPAILARRQVLESLVAAGCLLQITAGSLIGAFGQPVQKLTEWLLSRQLVHFVATDAHGIKSRRPRMRRAFDRLVHLAGHDAAVDLCCRHPAAVADGKDIAAPRRQRKDPSWFDWFRRRKAG